MDVVHMWFWGSYGVLSKACAPQFLNHLPGPHYIFLMVFLSLEKGKSQRDNFTRQVDQRRTHHQVASLPPAASSPFCPPRGSHCSPVSSLLYIFLHTERIAFYTYSCSSIYLLDLFWKFVPVLGNVPASTYSSSVINVSP